MRRREFITLLGGAAVSPPLAARAQQPAKMKRIAMVHASEKVGNMTINGRRTFRVLFGELGALGYVEGRNLLVERYSAEGRPDHYAELVRDVVRARPDLIIATAGLLAEEFKMATTTIPIVAIAADPVIRGLVPSLAHPGGNITGVSVDAGIQIWGKRLGLLREVIPKLSNARFLASQPFNWERLEGKAIREAASQAGITLAGAVLGNVIDEAAYQRVFTSMKQDQVDGLVVSSEGDHVTNRVVIVELAAKNRLPAIYPYKDFADVGGLMAYSVDLGEIYRMVADIVDKILKGANPGDIPFFQPTKFELVINLKTAKTLGLDLPPTLLARADEVIE
jgi:putative tryptophan/tyrosine transport system substrate-binding protein